MHEMSEYSGRKIENWDRMKKNVEDVNIMSIYTSEDRIVIQPKLNEDICIETDFSPVVAEDNHFSNAKQSNPNNNIARRKVSFS